MLTKGKSIKTESRFVVVRSWKKDQGETGINCCDVRSEIKMQY